MEYVKKAAFVLAVVAIACRIPQVSDIVFNSKA